jgi:hypothetical protein
MLAWKLERIVLAHGRWYDRDAERGLKRAFRCEIASADNRAVAV